MDYIQIIAIISVVLSGSTALLYPLLIGKPRAGYCYAGWIGELIETAFITLLALRIFGII